MTIALPSPGSVAEGLNRAVRRVFQASQQAEWSSAVLDAALPFCCGAALFTVHGARLKLERASFIDAAEQVSFETVEAPAIAQALATLEPVASAWSARELSSSLTSRLGPDRAARAFLFPLVSDRRAVAVLIAISAPAEPLDTNGLELVATVGGAAWELTRRRNEASPGASTGLIALVPLTATPPETSTAPVDKQSEWHRRARRFASVRVAELVLYQAAGVRQGRQERRLYDLFRDAIERERATFRAQFMEKSPSMVDYLHEELVRTLAQGEEDCLGDNYPGAMVHR